MTPGPDDSLTWKPLCRKRRRRICDEVSLPGTERFWTSFYCLSPGQKESTRNAWRIFKADPFDPRLRTHKIQRLSAHYGRTIYAVEIEGHLRSLFYLDGDTVVSLIVGTHDIYKA